MEEAVDIRKADQRDLDEVTRWLKEEEEMGVDGFFCNLNVIEDAYSQGDLYVLLDAPATGPVAFVADASRGPDILEVRHDRRGAGLGRKLAEFIIEQARLRDRCALDIECAPATSIPFWKRMGFQMYGRNRAYLLLEKRHELPDGASEAAVTITFFPEDAKWSEDVLPLAQHSPKAVWLNASRIKLAERVFLFTATMVPSFKDPVVAIDVDGKQLYKDKAKYQDAQRLGVRRDINGFFIDELTLPSAGG
jgi:GNAT superfamily N-acetyltransferase